MPEFLFIGSDVSPRLTGIFSITQVTGGGGRVSLQSPLPLVSETTGPIVKIQTVFDSPGKTVKRNLFSLTSRSPMT